MVFFKTTILQFWTVAVSLHPMYITQSCPHIPSNITEVDTACGVLTISINQHEDPGTSLNGWWWISSFQRQGRTWKLLDTVCAFSKEKVQVTGQGGRCTQSCAHRKPMTLV